MKVDREIDFHGFTAREMRIELDRLALTDAWRGWRRLRVIHGTGEVLGVELRLWCDERGIPWSPEPRNPGATVLHPFQSPGPPRRAFPGALKPRSEPRRKRTLARPIHPAASPEELKIARDLMKQEFEQLGHVPPDALRRRKRGMGPR